MSEQMWRQLTVLHLTDLHFGDQHAFLPPMSPAGTLAAAQGIPTLAQSVLADVARLDLRLVPGSTSSLPEAEGAGPDSPRHRTILALTGDLTERASQDQFDLAAKGIADLTAGLGLSVRDVFIVPGNHDVTYTDTHSSDRWARYCRFYQRHAAVVAALSGSTAPVFDPGEPQSLTRVIDQSNQGLIVVEINSSAFVEKGKPGERRGEVDQKAIHDLKRQLSEIDEGARDRSIRLALIHHHPVVLPGLADPGEGYDAVVSADLLLDVLKSFSFHLVLHGHKHVPHTFTYDAVCAWTGDAVRPLMVIAGGSAGSTQLRREPNATNTYNIVRIKWQPGAPQARIHVETRGLVDHDSAHKPLLGPDWHWKTLRVDDRLLSISPRRGQSIGVIRSRGPADDPYEDERLRVSDATRRNFPAIDVMPSLDPDQGYEARVWIEAQLDKPSYVPPDRVEWSGGRYFNNIHVVTRAQSPRFEASFSYFGPMLIQARMYWDATTGAKAHEASAYIFAHYPGQS